MSWSTEYENCTGTGLSGISEDPNDILVFGYGCKLFRDDEKAEWIEKEGHLIPWMGDPSLKIDRYDGRGALMDLRPFLPLSTPSPESTDPYAGLSFEESKLEKLLDKERYRDLREDSEFDDLNYQEVEFRKFQSDVNGVVGQNSYAAIGYSYDQIATDQVPSHFPEILKVDENLPFVIPAGLEIPNHVVVPTTIKLHAIIEKTAKFIASYGNQMEIILKTKQSGNALFNFLDYKDVLNPYYKFLVEAIRNNLYTPADDNSEVKVPAKSPSHEGSESEDDSNYLHPSLFKASVTDSTTTPVSNITYKSSTGPTAYSLLVSKIRGSTVESVPPPTGDQHFLQHPSSAYSHTISHSDSQGVLQDEPFVRPQSHVPAPNDQLVIEKMASYVVKNGVAFEELAKTKGDTRFVFLHPSHEFHWYYLNCKERFKAETSSVVASRNFVSYSDTSTNSSVNSSTVSQSSSTPSLTKSLENKKKVVTQSPLKVSTITLQSIQLPLSASGIPIANHASISSRPATIPPEVASRIEQIKKKNSLFAKKDLLLNSAIETKKEKAKIQFSSSIGKGMSLGLENTNSTLISDEEQQQREQDTGDSESVNMDITTECEKVIAVEDQHPLPSSLNPVDPSKPDDLGNGVQLLDKVPENKEMDRKEWRRRKAALFLQRINSKHKSPEPVRILNEPTETSLATIISNNDSGKNLKNGVETVVDSLSDVESIPDPLLIQIKDEQKENNSRSSEERLQGDELKLSKFDSVRDTKNGSSRSRSSSRHLIRSRSRSPMRSSSFRRSFSVSSESFSDSSQIRSKRSKRKHSKKRKKKRNKERSSSDSRSKKSKKHRR